MFDMILVEFAHLQSDIADFPSHIGGLLIYCRNDLDEPFIHLFLEAFYLLIVLCCSVEIHRYLTDKRHEHNKPQGAVCDGSSVPKSILITRLSSFIYGITV